jgi:cation/acetate symporter
MKGITWTQVAQYWVLITAFLIPAIAISFKLTGNPIPQLGLGSELITGDGKGTGLLEKLNLVNEDLGFKSYTTAFGGTDMWNMFCVTLALMAGTAGLPHVIVRFYTVKNVKAARWSAFWALLFIGMLYLTAPATAAFARYYMIESINGKTQQELPEWFENWEKTGLILWLDNGDGKLRYSNRGDNEVFNEGRLAGPAATIGWLWDAEGELAAADGPIGWHRLRCRRMRRGTSRDSTMTRPIRTICRNCQM